MKAAGNYHSLVQGVSEQPPELRPAGQVTDMVNMIPDPVGGPSRRHGSVWQAEKDLGITSTDPAIAAMTTDTANWRTFDYFSEGKDYTFLVRRAGRGSSTLPPVIGYNRTDRVFLNYTRNVTDAALDTFEANGAAAITNIGKFVFIAANGLVPQLATTDLWGATSNLEKSLVWIRGGAFARTYKVTATKLDNTQVTFSYTTPVASYPYALDTSGVPLNIPVDNGTSGTSATLTVASDVLSGVVEGGTSTLTHAPAVAGNFYQIIAWNGETGERFQSFQITNGFHYTLDPVTGIISWVSHGGLGVNQLTGYIFTATYAYLPGGSSASTAYATEVTTEALYIKLAPDSATGISTLNYGDWAPASLKVIASGHELTNVYPAQPANASQYSWQDGASTIVFFLGLVSNTHVTAVYGHIKVIPNPNYAKQIGDITNDYQTRVTNWIASSAAAIQPGAIAHQLTLAAVAAGLSTASFLGPNVVFDNVKSLSVDDGGDGSLIRGVGDEVASVDQVSTTHYIGKIVKVRGATSKESFYLKATAKDLTVTSGLSEVIWVEGAGVTYQADAQFIYIQVIGSALNIASNATKLAVLTSGVVPDYVLSVAGDGDTNPPPYFIGRQITYLGIFQDRLLVGCGGVIRASQTAEYLTFFRSTVLTLPASDAMEFLSQGAADDELRFGVLYDQNLVLFGLKRQYLISGKVPLTPTNANMVPMSNHADAAELPPLAVAGYIFYGKKGPKSSSMHQIQPSLAGGNSPDSFEISSQIDLYLTGDAIELAQIAKPATLFVRTAGARNTVFCFSYLDTQQGRRQDAWHRWNYSLNLGPVIGMQATSEGLLVFTLRTGLNSSGVHKTWVEADLQSLNVGLSTQPYLDSLRPYTDVATHAGWLHSTTLNQDMAFDDSSEFFLIGGTLAQAAGLITTYPSATGPMVGEPYEGSITPTSPFVKDNDGKAIVEGRLTVGHFAASFTASSGYLYDVTFQRTTETFGFNGRVFGDPANLIGREPVSNYVRTIPVGREIRDFTFRLYSRKWMPFTVASLSWSGQYFNRTQQR